MNELAARLIDLPTTIRAYTVQDTEGNYNIYVNARLSHEARLEAYKHEIKHIKNDDFSRQKSADLIEIYAHLNQNAY